MAFPAISQCVLLLLLLLFCLDWTLATADQLAAHDQNQEDGMYDGLDLNEESATMDDLIGEYNYVYIDDDGHGARFQYGGHGTEAGSINHLHKETKNLNLIKECNPDEAAAQSPAGQACDIEIKGADENRSGNIPWGIDGVYKMVGCYSGLPVYKREGKTRLQRRFLWFSSVFHDWDVGLGDFHKDQMNRPPLMYGASTPIKKRPELLGPDAWLVMNVYHPTKADVSYSPMNVSVACAQSSSSAEDGQQAATPVLKAQQDAASILRATKRRAAM